MPKTYYDSELTGAQIEAALEAIHGVVTPSNNGKVLYIEDGQIKAASASRWSGGAVLEPLSVTANGDYTPPSGTDGFDSVHVAVPSATLTTKSITQNGTYNASSDNADGYSSVTVNVSGGGSAVVQPLSVTQNGTYTPPSGVDGYAPVTVNVSGGGSDPSLPSEYQEVEYITFDGNEFMLVENLPSDYLIDVVASNSVSMNESCVVGYREVSNNDRDFEVRFNNGSLNVWARSSSYTYTVFASNPTGSTLNVVRDIVVACVNHVSGKILIGKYTIENMNLPFKGSLYAIIVYSVARTAGASTVMELSRKFIPCYRKADGEIGVYEVYTSTFYPNEGTGTLAKGPDVN